MVVLLSMLGCDVPLKMCTEMGCASVASIRLQAEADTLDEGTYSIRIDADGEVVTDCEVRMSMDTEECAGEQPCAAESTCDAIYATDSLVFTTASGAEEYVVTLSIEYVPPDADGPVAIIDFEDQVFQPEYDEFLPNGEGCDPVCLTPTEELVVVVPPIVPEPED